MNETRFLISEAAKTVDVETHVLRYWEEELDLPIARNEMGHRCYTRQDIQIFLSIKELKKKGFQLKTIKELIPVMRREVYSRGGGSDKGFPEKKAAVKMQRKADMAVEAEKIAEKKEDGEADKKEEFFRILDGLLTQIREMNHQEDRYKRLDAAIRRHQFSRKMVAATKEQGKKGKKKYSRKEKLT
ncbi:MAG: helix-turn-helix domain-containing protein [Ruminococcus sp.]